MVGPVRAQSAEDLRELAAELASEDSGTRAAAIRSLSSLPSSALPAIRARLIALRVGRPPAGEALAMLHEIRRATGSRRADDMLDISEGVPIVLATRRDRAILRIVEPILLERSLERIATTEALALVPEVLRLDRGAWEMEGRRATIRLGDRAAAAILRARSHEDPAGRTWARWSMRELSMEDPGRLVQRLEPRDLADVLLAWGETRSIDAMSIVASYVEDPRRTVREASREALRAYGQNGIWQAREQFRLRLGESAALEWSWSRTLGELYRRLDERRLAEAHQIEERARAAIERGDPSGASRELESLLARAPDTSDREIARLFAALADAWIEADELARARPAIDRAIRVSPADSDRARWHARLAYLEAESALASGTLDLEAYRRAAGLDPSFARAREVLATLEAQAAPPRARPDRGIALWIAASLIAALGITLVRERRGPPAPSPENAGADPSPEQTR